MTSPVQGTDPTTAAEVDIRTPDAPEVDLRTAPAPEIDVRPAPTPVVDGRSTRWANRRTAPDHQAKRTAKWAIGRYARATAAVRVHPDFLIVGAQRCGTTSLQKYLGRHPLVAPARFTKGTHYFDRSFANGMVWYQSHFPTVTEQAFRKVRFGAPAHAGESCSYYLFHPLALERIAEALPGASLIVMLRDPVERAYSHYNHEVARGFEDLSFEEALAREPERLDGEDERMIAEPAYDSFSWRHHSYFTRGLYAAQLERLYGLFDREQVHVLESGRFFGDPDAEYRRVLGFLGLPEIHLPDYERRYAYRYDGLDPMLRAQLAARYAEPNRQLYAALGTDFGWARP